LFVAGDVSFNSRLFVAGDVSFNNDLWIGGNINLASGKNVNYSGTRLYVTDTILSTTLSTTLSNYVQSSTLSNYVQSSTLSNYVQSSTLNNYVQSSTLNNYVQSSTLNNYVQLSPGSYQTGNISISGSITTTNGTINTGTGNVNAGNVNATAFYATSDSRIKTNILSIDGSLSMNILRQLQPASYQTKGLLTDSSIKYGFIAQDVEKCLPHSTVKGTHYIPNIYDDAFFIYPNILFLQHQSTSLFDASFLPFPIRLYDCSQHIIDCHVQEIINNTTFTLTKPLDCSSSTIFVYGQEVKDFHHLHYDSIFTVMTAAVKEMDQQLQRQQHEIQDLKGIFHHQDSRIQSQQQEIQDLKEQLQNILSRLP
jgi:hypothetical protein